jgi:5'-methylthioadenosine phosphorylase
MMKKRKLGIIGGSGLYKMEGFDKLKWKKIKSSWGKPSDEILTAKLGKEEICFIPRHARGHKINPTNINFRANIDVMKQLGVTDIISVSAVGSLKENLNPGKFVIVDQFIDRTFSRTKTFFDEEIVAHVSMAKPTSPGLSNCCEAVLKKLNIDHQKRGTYVVMEGPQFSTLAESNLYRSWNADVIGMTNMPEAKLAREAEIRYCTVAMVTDYDCWHPDHDEVDVSMVIKTLQKNASNAQNMIKEVIKTFKNFSVDKDPANNCLDVAIITDPKLRTKKTVKKLKYIAGRVLNKKNEN